MTASHRTPRTTVRPLSLIRTAPATSIVRAVRAAAPAKDPLQPFLPADFSGLVAAAPRVLPTRRVLAVGATIESARAARLGHPAAADGQPLSIA